MFAILEPMALPIAKPGLPCTEAKDATRISGAEVPKPTMVKPINKGETPRLRAIDEVPSTNRSAAKTKTTKPRAKAIKSIKDIISQEKGNYIYVNVASGSKIQAIACMMACMVLKECDNLQPFYAEPESYAAFEGKQQSFGIKDTIALPTYEIQTPKPKLLAALKIVSDQPNQKITKKEMAQIAEDQKIITINAEQENHSQARFASLDKNIIAPLEKEWKFIEVEKIGRNRWIKITQEGKDAAEFLI